MKRYKIRKGSILDWMLKIMLGAGTLLMFGAAGTDEMMEEMGTSMPFGQLVVMVLIGMALCAPWVLLELPQYESEK